MNSILLRPNPVKSPASTGRILAIEPDAGRAALLREVLREHMRIDLAIVTCTAEALRSIGDQVPDLVITSAFLQPADEAALSAHVSRMPAPTSGSSTSRDGAC